MAIDTLVHGSPATGGAAAGSVLVARSTRKPSIDVYFPQPFPRRLHGQGAWSRNINKRMRSPGADGERAGPAKAARTNGAGGE